MSKINLNYYKPRVGRITPRNKEIIRLVAQGKENKEIAQELNCSPHTIDAHLRKIFTILKINSRVVLTHYAIGTGILSCLYQDTGDNETYTKELVTI